MWRERPSIAVFAAQMSAAGTTATTAACITSATQAGEKLETTPSTGFSTKLVPSAVSGPPGPATTGTAISATTATPA